MKKSLLVIALILLAAFPVLQGCTTTGNESTATIPSQTATPAAAETPAANTEEIVLTLEELALYNGENGMPAYIAVDGLVYDVSNVPQWRNGQHNGFTAGQDLTEEIKNISPHGISKLNGLTTVGTLAQ